MDSIVWNKMDDDDDDCWFEFITVYSNKLNQWYADCQLSEKHVTANWA